jgi:V/A-type H+-transporting ATPase subunit C
MLDLISVNDIAAYLNKSAYAQVLKDLSFERLRRSDLEFLLGVSILVEGLVFKHYASQREKILLDMWLEYFDIMLFKHLFRRKLGTVDWDPRLAADKPDRALDVAADYHLTLVDKDKLFLGSTLKDIIMSVKNDRLRADLFEAVPWYDNVSATQGLEFPKVGFNTGMILDRYYLDNLYAAVAGFGGTEGRQLRMLVGARVDLMNIYWVYRARRFFNMSPEEALTLVVKARYRADFNLLTKVALAEPDAVKGSLSGTPYASVFEVDIDDKVLREVEIERNVCRFLFSAAQRVFMSGLLGFQNVAAYLLLKELEIRDIIAIVESIRYGFDKNKANLFLIRPFGKVN